VQHLPVRNHLQYDVIDAHCNQVSADACMIVQQVGEHQLGAYPVCSGYQHWLIVIVCRQLEQAAKTANSAEHSGAHGSLDIRLDGLDQLIAGINVDSGVSVAQSVALALFLGGVTGALVRFAGS